MKKIYTVVSILACLTFHACDNSKESMNNNVVDEAFPEFTAMIGESDTKTSLKGLDVIWSDDDRVAIFNGTVRAKEYKVKAGYSGSTTTILTPVNQDFTAGTEGSEMDGNVAFYPYSAVRSCKKTDDGYTLTVNFPENIESSPSSFGMGVMPMVAVNASKMDYNLSFKNLCGLLKLQLKGNGVKIYSITLEGNSNEKLLGMAEIRLFNNKTPEIRYEGTRTNQIKEICDEGIQLNDSKDIYIPIAPIEFTCGITVRIVTDEGEIVKATNKPIKVERSIITPMQVIDVAAELDKVSVIKYTSIDDNIVNVSWTDYTTEKKWIRSNYYLNNHETSIRRKLAKYHTFIYVVRGNHEENPKELPNMRLVYDENVNGYVYMDNNEPWLRFFQDGGEYKINGHSVLTLGGAYSVDKCYRKMMGYAWFPHEQLTQEERDDILAKIENKHYDIVLSHTCPFDWEPTDLFLSQIDQSTVDVSTELWMNEIKDKITYNLWLFGHFHDDRLVRPHVEMYFKDIEDLEIIYNRWNGENQDMSKGWHKDPNYNLNDNQWGGK